MSLSRQARFSLVGLAVCLAMAIDRAQQGSAWAVFWLVVLAIHTKVLYDEWRGARTDAGSILKRDENA